MENSASNGNENEQLVIDINSMVQVSEIQLSNRCCIRKVPYNIRKLNGGAYTPHTVPIGPYHHRESESTSIGAIKRDYSKSFMRRAENGISSENLETTIREMEDIIRRCYGTSFQLESHAFVSLIVVDATFILELFLNCKLGDWVDLNPAGLEAWRGFNVHRELLLLENQLPFFVIKKLYHLALPSLSNSHSLIQLTFDFFEDLNIHRKTPEGEVNHFADLLRFFALPPHDMLPRRERKICFPRYSATLMLEAGVKFVMVPSNSVLDLRFEGGVLGIPSLGFENDTEDLVLNVLALEQLFHAEDRYITDFYLILARLIKTDKDVKLLSEMGIIFNSLVDDNYITSMLKNLTRGFRSRNMNSNLFRACEDLNAFCDDPWNRWKVLVRRRYWGAVSSGAIILLLLTLLQTVCSIIQIVPIGKRL